jgi:hypothetical protein
MTAPSGLDLTEDGDDFVLSVAGQGGAITKIRLTEAQVLTLGVSSLSFQEGILSKRDARGGGASAVMAVAVDQFRVQSDSLGEDLLLTLQTTNGRQLCFAFPPHHAQRLAMEVPIEVAEMQKKPQQKPS